MPKKHYGPGAVSRTRGAGVPTSHRCANGGVRTTRDVHASPPGRSTLRGSLWGRHRGPAVRGGGGGGSRGLPRGCVCTTGGPVRSTTVALMVRGSVNSSADAWLRSVVESTSVWRSASCEPPGKRGAVARQPQADLSPAP